MTRPRDQLVAERYAEEVSGAWKTLLETRPGRLVIWSILEPCHIFHTTYTGNADTNFREGERSIGLKLLERHIFPHGFHYLADMMSDHAAFLNELRAAVEEEQED